MPEAVGNIEPNANAMLLELNARHSILNTKLPPITSTKLPNKLTTVLPSCISKEEDSDTTLMVTPARL